MSPADGTRPRDLRRERPEVAGNEKHSRDDSRILTIAAVASHREKQHQRNRSRNGKSCGPNGFLPLISYAIGPGA